MRDSSLDPRRPSDRDSTTSSTRRRFLLGAGAVGTLALGASATTVLGQSAATTRAFTVRLENVSGPDTLDTTVDAQPVPLSPGAWAVHSVDEPLFTAGHPERDNGLEEVAEDGMPTRLLDSLSNRDSVVASGAFTTPVGADSPEPLTPGDAYEFAVEASAGKPRLHLSLVTMFVPSNDLFYALGGDGGLALFRETGAPMAGDVTDHVGLWDAGTELNEEPGVGENQVQRQRGAGVGLVERGTVAPIEAVNGYAYPAVDDVLRLRLTPQ